MNSSPRLIPSPFGIARRSELLATGIPPAQIEAAWRDGSLIRVRHGVYAAPTADPAVLRAVRVGGALAGASAAARHRIWTPHEPPFTVSVPHNARRLRDPDDHHRPLDPERADVRIYRDAHLLHPRHERFVVSPATVVVQAITHLAPPEALATLDSALRLPAGDRPSARELAARLPLSRRPLLARADPRAESGTESAFRHGLLEAGIPFDCQVWITERIRVDFLVAGFLVVECQSREHHSDPAKYNQDRERISELVRLGFVVLEFTYAQVFFDWDGVWASFLAALSLVGSARPRPPFARTPRPFSPQFATDFGPSQHALPQTSGS